jgi:redox-sensitive bicupin YhaK (pirin superfamily)
MTTVFADAPGVTPDIDPSTMIKGRARDLGGFGVRRVLPAAERRLVGPFIFFDHAGPVEFTPGQGMDVRPHPHIGLATVTYLFEGEILHRDSLGTQQPIRPGDVNWMVAGRGIVHSERSPPEARARGGRLHAIQCWVALPSRDETCEPRFEHHPRPTIPVLQRPGAELTVIAGSAYGATAPTGVLSPTLYVHARMDPGATLPVDDGYQERAAYVVDGAIECGGRQVAAGTMVVFPAGADLLMRAGDSGASVMLVGGAPIDGDRLIWWNFVNSRQERIEQAKADWAAQRYATVPGDDERIPLPAS